MRAGWTQHANLLRQFPDRFAWHEQRQAELMERLDTARPHLSYTVDGRREWLTLAQFRQIQEAQIDLEFDSAASGCGCFTDTEV